MYWKALGIFALGVVYSSAQLQFKTTEVTHDIDPAQESVTIKFPFKALSHTTLLKENISCGCMTTPGQKKAWKKGEVGEYAITLDTKAITGKVKKSVDLEFSGFPTQTLTIHANLPKAITSNPKSHIWAKDQEAKEKTFEVTIHDAYDFTLQSLTFSNKAYKVTLERVTPEGETPQKYTVKVVPPQSDKKEICVITLQTSSQVDRFKTHKIIAIKQ